MTCPHEDIHTSVNVHTTVDTSPDRRVLARVLSMTVSCKACGTSFWFPGLPTGQSFAEPVTSIDGFTLSVPLVEENQKLIVDPALTSLKIQNNDTFKGTRARS